MFVLPIHVTRVGHNLCNPHHWTPGRFKIILMHGHSCKSLLNTLGRAVEQLAGCLAKQAKSQQLRSKYMTVSKRVFPFSRQWHQVTPIAPPTGCGIRPVPNRNLSHISILGPILPPMKRGSLWTRTGNYCFCTD